MKLLAHISHFFIIAVLLLATGTLTAEQTSGGELDARMLQLTSQLRCLVCQNETLADSKADLAVSLRQEIRDMMQRGASDRQIVDFLVARYGDFVLYRPPVKRTTWLLWFGPALLFAVAAGVGILIIRRRRLSHDTPLSAADRARVQRILQPSTERDSS